MAGKRATVGVESRMRKLTIILILTTLAFLGCVFLAVDTPVLSFSGDGAESVSTPERSETTPVSFQSIEEALDGYSILNDAETRYAEYKDSDDMLKVKLLQLEYINKSRTAFGAPPVALDILASRVANRMAKEAAEEGFSGHWNTRGEKPYHRYAFAGGLDHVSENAAALSSTQTLASGLGDFLANMRGSHDSFMAEVAPQDGHKRNCIDVEHNFVGLGCWIDKNRFRYYEEFIDRYLEFVDVRHFVSPGEGFTIRARPLSSDQFVFFLIAYYEAFPGPMSPAEINARGSYPDYTDTTAFMMAPWELERDESTGTFDIPLKFDDRGLYYLHIYLSDTEFDPASTVSVSTEGRIQASGLVIRVE